ncbi:MAG: histidine phosphatase family protein [Paracoccaceae bacterium]
MSVLHWVRHGPTHQKSFVGWRDVPADLSDQALVDRVSDYLPADALVVSSDLQRSVQTASAICGTRQRLPHMPGLREFHFGAWDGQIFSDIANSYPVQSRAYWEKPGDIAPPGGESWHQAAQRVSTAADLLVRQNPDRHIIIVAHIGAILTQVQRAVQCSAYEVLAHKIDNLSITQIDLSQAEPQVLRINHLP